MKLHLAFVLAMLTCFSGCFRFVETEKRIHSLEEQTTELFKQNTLDHQLYQGHEKRIVEIDTGLNGVKDDLIGQMKAHEALVEKEEQDHQDLLNKMEEAAKIAQSTVVAQTPSVNILRSQVLPPPEPVGPSRSPVVSPSPDLWAQTTTIRFTVLPEKRHRRGWMYILIRDEEALPGMPTWYCWEWQEARPQHVRTLKWVPAHYCKCGKHYKWVPVQPYELPPEFPAMTPQRGGNGDQDHPYDEPPAPGFDDVLSHR